MFYYFHSYDRFVTTALYTYIIEYTLKRSANMKRQTTKDVHTVMFKAPKRALALVMAAAMLLVLLPLVGMTTRAAEYTLSFPGTTGVQLQQTLNWAEPGDTVVLTIDTGSFDPSVPLTIPDGVALIIDGAGGLDLKNRTINVYGVFILRCERADSNGATTINVHSNGTFFADANKNTGGAFNIPAASLSGDACYVIYHPGTQGTWDASNETYTAEYYDTTPLFGTKSGASVTDCNEGWEFDDWSPTPNPTVTGNAIYFARWKRTEYTVTYNIVNGTWGGTLTTVTETVTHGDKLTNIPTNMAPDAAYTQNTGEWDSTAPTTSTVVTAPMTFTYRYATLNNYTVTFRVVNGTWSGGTAADINGTHSHGAAFPSAPTGMTPVAAYSNSTGSWDINPSSWPETVTGNVTYTYTFNPINTYTVTYNANWPGVAGAQSGTVPANASYAAGATVTVAGNTGALAKAGYTFLGWSASGTATTATYGSPYGQMFAMPSNNVTLYAVWAPVTYQIIYNANGGAGAMANQTATYGQNIALTGNAFTRAGYTFTGWNTAANGGGTSYANGYAFTPWLLTANLTLYAQWTENAADTYTVTYEPGAQGTFTAQSTSGLVSGAATPGFAGTPTGNAGWTFTGWSPSVASTVTGNATYTAQWTQVTPPDPPRPPINPDYPLQLIDPDDPIYENILDWLPPLGGVGLDKGDHNWYIRGYTDDTVRPEGYITRAEMAMIFYRLTLDDGKHDTVPRRVMSDVDPAAWYAKAVTYLYDNDIIRGYDDDTFRPNAYVTRAEATAMAVKFDQFTLPMFNPFYDMTTEHWAAIPILAAWNNGWLFGYETDATIRPDENLTRAEMVTFINRVLVRLAELEEILPTAVGFGDITSEHWAYCDIMEAANSHDFERKYADEDGDFDSAEEIWTAVTGNGKDAEYNE